MPADFEKQSYWHRRFASETSFEWLVSSATFISIIEPYLSCRLPHHTRILQLGSGTSDLQNCFRARGYLDVTNVDYEPRAIERGRQIEAQAFGDVRTKYAVADVTQLSQSLSLYQPESESESESESQPQTEAFDLVVDKSTVDAVSCGGETALWRMACSVRRCLASGGIWISLSFSSYRFDIDCLPFDVEVIAKIPTPKLKPTDPDVFFWCYLLRPREVEMKVV